MSINTKYINLSVLNLVAFIYSSNFPMDSLPKKTMGSNRILKRSSSDREFRKVFSFSDEEVLKAKVDIFHARRNIEGLITFLKNETETGKLIIRNYFKTTKLNEYISDAHRFQNTRLLKNLLDFFEEESKEALQIIINELNTAEKK